MENDWSGTVDEAVTQLLEILSDEEKETLRKIPKSTVKGECHFGLSVWVRNHFGLHRANEALLNDCGRMNGDFIATVQGKEIFLIDPDSASGIIIMAAWKRLRATESK